MKGPAYMLNIAAAIMVVGGVAFGADFGDICGLNAAAIMDSAAQDNAVIVPERVGRGGGRAAGGLIR